MAEPRMDKPTKPVNRDFARRQVGAFPMPHKVIDGQSWRSIAADYHMAAKNLIYFNFGTSRPAEINWYMYNYVGCRRKSPDGRSWSFTINDKPGMIWIPTVLSGTVGGPLKITPAAPPADFVGELFLKRCPETGMRCITPELAAHRARQYQKTAYEGLSRSFLFVEAVRRGQVFKTAAGERVVIAATSTDVYFVLNGRFYVQDGADFLTDAPFGSFGKAAHSARGMVILAQIEMALFMGILGGSSAVGFVAVMGTNVTKFFVENDVPRLVGQMIALYAAYQSLDAVAPTLTDKIFEWSTAGRLFWGMVKRLPDAIMDMSAEEVAGLLGSVIGKLGKKVVFEAIEGAWIVLKAIAVFVATGMPQKTGKIFAEEQMRLAKQLAAKLKSVNVVVSEAEAKAIVDEILANPEQVERVMKELKAAMK